MSRPGTVGDGGPQPRPHLLEADIVQRALAAGLEVDQLGAAVRALVACFRAGRKVLIFGNGGSAAQAQHMAAELVGRVKVTRPPLPAIAITSDGAVLSSIVNDFGPEQVFARQVTALGQWADVAVAMSTSGESLNVLAAVEAALSTGMRVIAFTGSPETPLARLAEVAVTSPADDVQGIQEAHLVAIHLLCETVERQLLGVEPDRREATNGRGRVLELADLLALRASWRAEGRVVVWTNGVFDLLHLGHVRSLEMAKDLGDVLVVGVNADGTVPALKGRGRPVVADDERAQIVAAIGAVDVVTIFHEEDPSRVLAVLEPDIHCKGEEYEHADLPERAVVEAYGGRVEFLPRVPGLSSSELLRRSTRLPSSLDR
jgi:rfaE bifunctional protein nucleotidyltransferase chain/domain